MKEEEIIEKLHLRKKVSFKNANLFVEDFKYPKNFDNITKIL